MSWAYQYKLDYQYEQTYMLQPQWTAQPHWTVQQVWNPQPAVSCQQPAMSCQQPTYPMSTAAQNYLGVPAGIASPAVPPISAYVPPCPSMPSNSYVPSVPSAFANAYVPPCPSNSFLPPHQRVVHAAMYAY
jgi:hypothetical protein